MAARRRKRGPQGEPRDNGVRSVPLEPIRTVERVLTRPDGTRMTVQVPVYPPFQLDARSEPRTPPKAAARRQPAVKRKASDAS